MSTPAVASASVVTGLTHPVGAELWFGCKIGGYFFRLVDGDEQIAVLRDSQSLHVVDTVPFRGDGADPRRDLRQLAVRWLQDKGAKLRGR